MKTNSRDRIFALVQRMKAAIFPDRQHDIADCLTWAIAGLRALDRYGVKAVLQAGTMQWKMVPDAVDDGKMMTHFGYMWDPDSMASKVSVAMGNLPEVHCWLGVVETQEVIDFSTHGLFKHAVAAGFKWIGQKPPQYLWCGAESMPDGVRYLPNMEATVYAAEIAIQLIIKARGSPKDWPKTDSEPQAEAKNCRRKGPRNVGMI